MATPSKSAPGGSSNPAKKSEDSENTAAHIAALISGSNLISIANKNDFYNIIKEIRDRLLLVEFFAQWCGPCKSLSTKLEELANSYNGKILIVKVDVDEFEDIALEYDVSAMPTFMVIKNQQKLQQFSSSNFEVLESTLEKFVGKPGTSGEAEKSKEGAAKKDEATKKSKRSSKSAAKN